MDEQKFKILLIEDNPGDAKLIQKLLPDDAGIEIEWVDRLQSGLDQLKGKKFDGLLLDLSLPDSKGLDTFMKTQKQSPNLPVLIITGLDDKEMALEAVRNGAQDYLVKGLVDGNLLVRAINYAIERKKTEEKIRLSEKKLKNIIESSPDAITVTGLDGKITDVNKASMELYGAQTKEELIGKSVMDFIADKDRNQAMENLEKTIEEGLIKNLEYTLLTKDGREFPAEISASVIRDVSGEPVSFVGITSDISKRKNAYERLKASIVEKDRLLLETHTRMKNNLEVIFNLLDAQYRNIEDKNVKKMFRKTQSYIRSMGLIHEKIVQSKDLELIDFNEYIREFITYLFITYGDYITDINLNIDIEKIQLDIHRSIICGLIVNELMSNALMYAFPYKNDGEIILKVKAVEENGYSLVISDNGVGIPPYIDFKNTESLGLRSVVALVKILGGDIRLDRRDGTTFTIEFEE